MINPHSLIATAFLFACMALPLPAAAETASGAAQPAPTRNPPAPEDNALDKVSKLQRAGVLVAQGRTALEQGRYPLAAEIFRQALLLEPNNLMAAYGMGAAMLLGGAPAAAIPHFTRAASINAAYWPAYSGRGKAHFDMGNMPAAEADLRLALSIRPDETKVRLMLADTLRGTGKGEEAAKEYTGVLDAIWQGQVSGGRNDILFSSSTIGAVLASRGEARFMAGQNEKAIEDFDSALEFTSRPEQALAGKGSALFASGKLEESEVALSSAIAITKANPFYFVARGNTRLALGNAAGAEEDFTSALTLDAGMVMALANRAIARKAQGHTGPALEDLKAAIKLAPSSAALYNNRGNLYLATGDAASSLKDYRAALRLSPTSPQAMSGEGASLVELGKYREAVKVLDRAIAAESKYPPAYHNRAAVRLEMGKYEEALADADMALKLDPNDNSAKVLRGIILFNLGRWSEGSRAVMEGRKHLENQAAPDCALAFVDWTFNRAPKPALEKLRLCLSKGLYSRRILVSPHQGGKFLKGMEKLPEYREILKTYPVRKPADAIRQQ